MSTPPTNPYEFPTAPIGEQPPEAPGEGDLTQYRPRRRWPWVLGIILALIMGAALGASGQASASDGAASSRIAELQTALDEADQRLDSAESERDTALEDLQTAQDARDSAREDLAAAEDERDDAISRAEDAEAELAAAEEKAAEEEASSVDFGDGTWVVGEDIEAGTYRNGGDGGWCYWERLSGLSGEFGDIIANGNPDGPAVVEISKSDAAFASQGCGTWTKQ